MHPSTEEVWEREKRTAEYCHGKPLNEDGWRMLSVAMRDWSRWLEVRLREQVEKHQ